MSFSTLTEMNMDSSFDQLMDEFLEKKDDVTEDIHLAICSENLPMVTRAGWYIRDKCEIFYSNPIGGIETRNSNTFELPHHEVYLKNYNVREDFEKHRKFIKFYTFPNIFRKKPKPDACPLRNFILHVIYIYIFIKLTLVSIMQYIMIYLMQNWNPIVRPDANRTEFCALREDIDEAYDEQARKFLELRDFSRSLGYSAIYSAQILSFTVFVYVSAMATLYVGFILYKNDSMYLDTLSFLCCPVEERKRIKVKLNEIVHELREANDFSCDVLDATHTNRTDSWLYQRSKSTWYIEQQPERPHKHDYEIYNRKCRCAEERQRKLEFVDFISDEKLIDYVRPAHLTINFYKQILRRNIITGVFHVSLLIFAFFAIAGRGNRDESVRRVRDRLEIYQCEQWNENSTLIRDVVGLGKRPLQPELKNLYLEYQEKRSKNTEHLEAIELAGMYQWNSKYILAEILFMYLGVLTWTYHYVLSFVQGTMSINKWLGQIRTQMDNCIKLIDHHLDYCADINSNLGIRFGLDDEAKVRLRDIEKALTITYLNFELFRQEYKAFERVSSFLIFHLIPLVAFDSLFSYWVSITSTKDIGVVFIYNAVHIFMLNFFISYCVAILNKVLRLYYIIERILTRSSSISLDQSQIAILWRRQLLSDRDLKQYYSVKVLNANFSSSTMIGINSYVMALWLMMGRQMT